MTPHFPFPVEQRIERVLRRLACSDVRVVHHGDGIVSLVSADKRLKNRALAMAAAKTVPGVTEVSYAE